VSDRNPLREGLKLPRVPAPCALVIFGASGDLTRRKLFPAIYSLAARGLLPEHFAIVGVSRTEETDAEFKARMKEAVQEFGRDKFDEKVWKRLSAGMHYVAADVSMNERTNNAYYKATIRIPPEQMRLLDGTVLQPGMPTEVYILASQRTMLGYLFQPLRDSFNRAFRER